MFREGRVGVLYAYLVHELAILVQYNLYLVSRIRYIRGKENHMPLVQPLSAFRFRLNCGGALQKVTENTEYVKFDLANRQVTIRVRATVEADAFDQAMRFARILVFTVEAMHYSDVAFSLRPLGHKLISHTFDLEYAATGCAGHDYVFSYDTLDIGEPIKDEGEPNEALPSDPNFPSVAEVAERFNFSEDQPVELDLTQEMRFTPDNPDRDGDGVADSQDEFPDDPTRQ